MFFFSRHRSIKPPWAHVLDDRLLQGPLQNRQLPVIVEGGYQQKKREREHGVARLRRIGQSGHIQNAHTKRSQYGSRLLRSVI